MSAIAGIYNKNQQQIPTEFGQALMNSLSKFPADDIRTLEKENVFLGCHAQWITPEHVGETLPYYDHDRKLAITADAVIDNRNELFEMLQINKFLREGMSDSELILYSYHKWGENCPKYLIGDFAFMICDELQKKLFGARDFSGSRTLYYNQNQSQFSFCTIIEPLLSLPGTKKVLNEEWLAEFLAISSVIETVDTFTTPYKGIKQLPPSHSITVVNNEVSLKRYCILQGEKLKLKTNEEYEEAFNEVFHRAVEDRLRTHKKVGSHLSGGLDSGAVVSFAVNSLRDKNKTLHTFSYVPPKDFYDFTPKYRVADETSFIKSTVSYVGGIKDHYLDFKSKSPLDEVDTFLEILETPYKFFENSIWLKGIFEKAQEKNIGILLNGGRGNMTISWGPALEYYGVLLKRLQWVKLLKELRLYSNNLQVNKSRSLSYVIRLAFPQINKVSPKVDKYHSLTLINSEFAQRTDVFNNIKSHGIDENKATLPNIFEQKKSHFEELFHWNATNTMGTKLSLRHSIWKRDPTNDLRVIRFCLSVPESQFVQKGLDRALIRRSLKGKLPEDIRLNQLYRGVQGVDWVHRMTPAWNMFVDELEELKNDNHIFEYLNEKVVNSAIEKVKDGPKPEYALDPYFRIAIRSLIVYRFLKKFN
ncbi:lasso peptide isopeptide bond-forming cyclase [Halobacillus sp. BBL2006]|uniref:lasso peptide isopeptide bond-forming cyclase n=1 Tax=Halobacillus sp. BBL2006 TaxID=1543706 RepID=UPI0005420FA0|nr:lasso peptide isopeptide bond-forming cyclase [Halobacillus sp. BBL2006]KHE69231.1 asparagine synthase [Halobacillus sp. BBL2006]